MVGHSTPARRSRSRRAPGESADIAIALFGPARVRSGLDAIDLDGTSPIVRWRPRRAATRTRPDRCHARPRRDPSRPPDERRVVRVAIVSGICVRNDAISTCVVDQLSVLREAPRVTDVALFTEAIDRQLDVPVHVVTDAWSLLVHPAFAAADLVIYHWGIAYDLFDSLVAAPRTERSIAVHFHNATPAELLTGADRAKGRARRRRPTCWRAAMSRCGPTASSTGERSLDLGVRQDRLHHVPIAIDPPFPLADRRHADEVRLLVVGRLVPAKGIHVAVDAIGRLDADVRDRVRLTIAGNVALSDRDLRRGPPPDACARLQMDDVVTIVDNPSRDDLWHLYERSHVVVSPSFHEGLCVPIIEGYLAGCRAIGTDAGNVPFAVQPPDPVVPAGDADALGRRHQRRRPSDPGAATTSTARPRSAMPRGSAVSRARAPLLERVASAVRSTSATR